MTKNYVMVDLADPRTARIAEVMGNKTCKKILGLLSDKELSESELATRLNVPMNTINYNVKKLVAAGLIESSRSFWSVKGRKVQSYKISERKIVISPKTMTGGILPALLATGAIAFGIKLWSDAQTASSKAAFYAGDVATRGTETIATAAGGTSDVGSTSLYSALANAPSLWAWFFVGALFALAVVLLWNWFRK